MGRWPLEDEDPGAPTPESLTGFSRMRDEQGYDADDEFSDADPDFEAPDSRGAGDDDGEGGRSTIPLSYASHQDTQGDPPEHPYSAGEREGSDEGSRGPADEDDWSPSDDELEALTPRVPLARVTEAERGPLVSQPLGVLHPDGLPVLAAPPDVLTLTSHGDRDVRAVQQWLDGFEPHRGPEVSLGRPARLNDVVSDEHWWRLYAIGEVIRTLHVIHSFGDGNRRLNVHLLLPRLLSSNGFRPLSSHRCLRCFLVASGWTRSRQGCGGDKTVIRSLDWTAQPRLRRYVGQFPRWGARIRL